jgi:nicotinate-nucleotide adenylyltransferase
MAMKRGRIGLFGGSFDPVHNGHLAAARKAREAGGLDEVVFIPAATSPLKIGHMVASDADRLAMLRLALAGEAAFSVSDYELAKSGVSYTIDTVRHFTSAWPEARIVLILGADSLATLFQWREAQALVDSCEILTLARPGWPVDRVSEFDGKTTARLLSGVVADFSQPVSSSEVRHRLETGHPVAGLVPAPVADYIQDRGLYRRSFDMKPEKNSESSFSS